MSNNLISTIVLNGERDLLNKVGLLKGYQIFKIDQIFSGEYEASDHTILVRRWVKKASENDSNRRMLIKKLQEELQDVPEHEDASTIEKAVNEATKAYRSFEQNSTNLYGTINIIRSKSHMYKCPSKVVVAVVVLCVLIVADVILMAIGLGTFAAFLNDETVHLNVESFPVVQNETIVIGTIEPHWMSSVTVSEVLEKASVPHNCELWLMQPLDFVIHQKVKHEHNYGYTAFEDTIILREEYVYLFNESKLEYNICLAINGSSALQRNLLYIFDSEDAYFKYYDNNILDSLSPPVYSGNLMMGINNEKACTHLEFTSTTTSFFFAILKVQADVKFHYNRTAWINHLQIGDYSKYEKCVVNDVNNCSLTIGSSFFPETTSYAIMAYAQPIKYLSTYINHLQLQFNPRMSLLLIPGLAFIALLAVASVIALSCICCRIRRKKRSQYAPLLIN